MKFKITYKMNNGENHVIEDEANAALDSFRNHGLPMSREEVDDFFDYTEISPDAVAFTYQNPDDPQTTADWSGTPKHRNIEDIELPK